MSRLNPAPDLSQARLRAGAGAGAGAGVGAGPREPSPSPPGRQRSGSASSSSTDTSEEEERQRQEYLGEYGGPPSVTKPMASAAWVIILLFLVCQSAGLWLFTRGFLLTRVTLDGKAKCDRRPTTEWMPPLPSDGSPPTSPAALAAWDASLESTAECTLPAAFSRSVVFIIDALRYDFIAPVETASPSWSPDPNYHSVLTLPQRLDAQAKSNPGVGATSFLSHFLADAPTTTLQRLKGLTTGTLPTFIDAGSNFAGSEIDEDSWLGQLKARNLAEGQGSDGQARLAFMGDDTWLSTFPSMFDKNWTWPFDSFNVEDLDTVDLGVEASLLPFLDASAQHRPKGADLWSLLVAHTLGVDHVGHRFGASHPKMRTKLEEMEVLLGRVIDKLPDDALFVLLGDHGMDERGDHGGDGELEVGAALWVYAKGSASANIKDGGSHAREIANLSHPDVPSHRPFSPLPLTSHRSVPQIDLVPTLSLLLGLPIPFNNLGTIIPELFPPTAGSKDRDRYLRALRINARQIRTYLGSYAKKSDDLTPFEAELEGLWLEALKADASFVAAASAKTKDEANTSEARRQAAQAYMAYTRTSLLRAQSVWAQFQGTRMALGLALLALSLLTTFALRQGALHGMITGWGTREDSVAPKVPGKRGARLRLRRRTFAKRTDSIEAMASFAMERIKRGALFGAGLGLGVWAIPGAGHGLDWTDLLAAGASFGAQISLLLSQHHVFTSPSTPTAREGFALVLPLLHAAGFGSVAFVIWEDFAVASILVVVLGLRALLGFLYAPTRRLQRRISFLGVASGVALRLAAFVHVCREEQGPKCRSTFYAGGQLGGAALNSPYAMAVAYVVALVVPSVVGWILSQSKSNAGIAPLYLTWILRPTLVMGAGYWLADWAAPSEGLSLSTKALLETVKLGVGRADLVIVSVIGGAFWLFAPLCLEMRREQVELTPAQLAAQRAAANGLEQQPVGNGAPAQPMTRVVILGFANSMGSSYLLFAGLVFSLLFLVAQPMGQLALTLAFLSIVALAELGDCERDAALLRSALIAGGKKRGDQRSAAAAAPTTSAESSAAASAAAASSGLPTGSSPPPLQPPTLLETSTLALLGFLAFFATGHQATLPSIQWRTAFIGLRTVSYPLSPTLVSLNAFGPLVLLPALSVPLLVLWNVAPRPRTGPGGKDGRSSATVPKPIQMPTASHLLSTSLGFILYHTLTTLATAFFAMWFRRHLMLFKLWTPRFMLGVVSLVGAHLGTALGITASSVVLSKVATTFGSAF